MRSADPLLAPGRAWSPRTTACGPSEREADGKRGLGVDLRWSWGLAPGTPSVLQSVCLWGVGWEGTEWGLRVTPGLLGVRPERVPMQHGLAVPRRAPGLSKSGALGRRHSVPWFCSDFRGVKGHRPLRSVASVEAGDHGVPRAWHAAEPTEP